jgi:hypothetical protein
MGLVRKKIQVPVFGFLENMGRYTLWGQNHCYGGSFFFDNSSGSCWMLWKLVELFLLHLCFVEHNKNQNMQYCDISSRLPIFWCCHVRDSSFLEGKPTDKLCWTDKNICISLKWDLQENSIQPTIIWVYISLIVGYQRNYNTSTKKNWIIPYDNPMGK